MDVNAALERLRALTAEALKALDAGDPVEADVVASLLEASQAIDEWLSRGGFLPEAWRAAAAG